MVTHILKKLIEQVTICTVELDPIKAGRERVFRSSAVLSNNTRNLIELERARSHERLLRANQAHVAVRRYRARRNGKCPVKINRAPHATDMPQLQNDSSPPVLTTIGHPLPSPP